MAGKVFQSDISLGGKVDGSFIKAVNQTKTLTNGAAKTMGRAMTDSTKAATKIMTKSLKSVATGALKVFGVIKSLSMLKDYASETMTAAKAQIEVQTKLESVLENVKSIQIRGPNAAAEAAKELSGVAEALEKTGVVGDDVIKAGMQQLATYQLSEKEISVLSSGMADLLAQQKGLNASQGDGVGIGNLIGKAMMGNVGALSKVGITFNEVQAKAIKTGDATLRAATIAEVLKDNVGGVNKALGETDQGQMVQAQNTFDEIKETLGYFLLPLMNQFIKGVLPYAKKGLESLTGVLDKAGPVISEIIGKGFEKLNEIMPFITQGIADVLPIVQKLMSTFGMTGSPLTIFLDLFHQLQPVIMDVINAIIPLIPQVVDMLVPAFKSLIPPIANIIKKLLPVLISLFNKIAPVVMQIVSQIAPLVVILINALMPAFESLIPPIMSVVNSLLPVLVTLFGAVMNIIRALAPVISFIAQVISTVLGAAIQALLPIIKGIIQHFSNIINILSSVIDFIVNIFTGNWSGAWESIKSIFSGIFSGIADIAKVPLNMVIKLVNSAINGINGLTDIINKIPGVEIGKIPQIPYLAKGATVTSPTLAMIGEGKVPETVVPHNNAPRSRALLAEAARGVGVTTGTNSYLPAIDKINSAFSYFANRFNKKNSSNSDSNNSGTINNTGGKTYNYYFAPVVNAKDAQGVKEVLDDEYEKFKRWVKRMKDEEDREVFA